MSIFMGSKAFEQLTVKQFLGQGGGLFPFHLKTDKRSRADFKC